jgi:hypothetical protein
MVATTLGLALMLAPSTVGGLFHRHKVGCDGGCGAESAFVAAQIQTLQTCPRWRDRDRAAARLRKIDWQCHPEVVDALVVALLNDCEDCVRKEAAESLAKLAPCLPQAHEALARAAECAPDHGTRKWARKGLKALAKRCEGTCSVCVPAPFGPPVPPTTIEEPVLMPTMGVGPVNYASAILGPPPAPVPVETRIDVPPAVGPSPFATTPPSQPRAAPILSTRPVNPPAPTDAPPLVAPSPY